MDGLVSAAQRQAALKPGSTCCVSHRNTSMKSRIVEKQCASLLPRLNPLSQGVFVHIAQEITSTSLSPSLSYDPTSCWEIFLLYPTTLSPN